MLRTFIAIVLIGLLGCGKQSGPAVPSTTDHSSHGGHKVAPEDHSGHAGMPGMTGVAEPVSFVVDGGWENLRPGTTETLTFHLERDGKPMRAFALLHERVMHFIVVRDALDEFQHLHPRVSDEGIASVEITFPTPGKYLIYVDCQPSGEGQQTARHEIQIAGDPPTKEVLKVDVPGTIVVGDSEAKMTLQRADGEWKLTYAIFDLKGNPLIDLEPYLGAMGHLVVIGAANGEYVHAHAETHSAPDGRVEFAAHFARPGLYKAWGQFQRNGTAFTIPAVLRVD